MSLDSIPPHELPWEKLSERELACLRGAAEHKRADQIADEHGLKPGSVQTYLSRATGKLELSNRKAAVRAFATVYMNVQSNNADVPTRATLWLSRVLKRLPWPFPTRWRPTNTMSAAGTILAIAIAATTMLAAAALYLLALALFDSSDRDVARRPHAAVSGEGRVRDETSNDQGSGNDHVSGRPRNLAGSDAR